ncbi:hypothetical protein [Enterococcus rotai]|uniref:hypothetical protein n=1 Tax=Enterococcus rotai TaxID=118060 RepID=UPI0032B4A666
MKKYSVQIFFLMLVISVMLMGSAETVNASNTTDLTITFFKNEVPLLQEPINNTLTLPETNLSVTRLGKLPSTGDLITSLIWTLTGCSVLIVLVGVYSLKNIMLTTTWKRGE